MEKRTEERLGDALREPNSIIKKACLGFLKDAKMAADRIKDLKGVVGVTELFVEEETKRLRGQYEELKKQALAALEFIDSSKFKAEVQQNFAELDKHVKGADNGQD